MDAYQPAPSSPKSSNTAIKVIAIGCGGLLLLGLIAGGIFTWFAAQKVKEFGENPAYGSLRLAVAGNPDLETVESDPSTGTVTVLDRRNGKTTKLTVNSLKDGQISFESDGNQVVMGSNAAGEGQIVVRDKEGKVLVAKGGEGGGTLTVTGANGQVEVNAQAGGSENGPKLPDWLPRYAGATPKGDGGLFNTTPTEISGVVGFTSTDPASKVVEAYAEQLKGAGLEVKTRMVFGEGGMIAAASADEKRNVSVTFATEEGKTSILVTFTERM